MLSRFFNPEGTIWKPLGYLGDFVILSLLWAICCIPIVTIGCSTTALYDTAAHALRKHDDTLFGRFFRTFKRELKTGILTTLLWLAVLFILYLIYRGLLNSSMQGMTRSVVLIFYLVLVAFFVLCILSWVFPILSRFTFNALSLTATSIRIAFGNILRSAALAAMIAATLYLSYRFAIPLMVLPGAVAFVSTFLIEPVFARYIDPENS